MKIKSAANKIFEMGGQQNIDFLIQLLEHENSQIRNAVSLTFRDHSFNQAVEPLFRSIKKVKNKDFRGTMVYALGGLDCSNKLVEVFELLLYGNFEVKVGAAAILDEQEFGFTKEDLSKIQMMWDDCQKNPNQCISNDFTLDILRDYVDAFMAYK